MRNNKGILNIIFYSFFLKWCLLSCFFFLFFCLFSPSLSRLLRGL